jgi:peptide/nickel transport system substrate-binding protein
VLLAACGETTQTTTKQATTITLSIDQEPDTMVAGIGSMMARTEILGAIATDLVRENDKPEFIALAAESKPTLGNGGAKFVGTGTDRHLEVTFKIKPHNWQDGKPVTAEDAVFGWKLFMDLKFPAGGRDLPEKLWDLQAVDSKTIVAKFMSEAQAILASKGQHPVLKDANEYADYKDWAGKGPVVDALYFLAGDFLYPKHLLKDIAVDKLEKSDFARKPIYNGPYKFKEWVAGQSITVEAVDNFFLGTPKVKNLVFRFFKDSSTIIAALRAGELDVALQIGLDLDNNPELQPLSDRFNIYLNPGTKWEHIDFNLDDKVTGDAHVRKAIAYGINRKSIIDNLLFGKSEIVNAFIPNWHPFYKPNAAKVVTYAYDPAKAEQELQAAGYTKGSDGMYAKDGKKLTIKLETTTATLRKQTGQLIQSDLKKIGITVDTQFLVGRGLFTSGGKGPLSGRTFQMAMYTWLAAFDPNASGLYLGKNTPTKANGYSGQNFPGYKGADDLLQQADLNAENVVNEPKRIGIYGDVLKQWTTDLPVLPLFLRISPILARKQMKNFKPTRTSAPETWNAWEWELPAK